MERDFKAVREFFQKELASFADTLEYYEVKKLLVKYWGSDDYPDWVSNIAHKLVDKHNQRINQLKAKLKLCSKQKVMLVSLIRK